MARKKSSKNTYGKRVFILTDGNGKELGPNSYPNIPQLYTREHHAKNKADQLMRSYSARYPNVVVEPYILVPEHVLAVTEEKFHSQQEQITILKNNSPLYYARKQIGLLISALVGHLPAHTANEILELIQEEMKEESLDNQNNL